MMVAPLVMSAALAIAREFLPALADTFSRPGGRATAEAVVNAAAAVAGVSPATPADQMIQRIKADPAASAELVQELQMVDREVYLAEVADRDRARSYQLQGGTAVRSRGNWMIIGVSAGLVACIGGVIWLTLTSSLPDGRIPEGVLALITTVAGAMLKMLSDAFSFEFGSSQGSRDKDMTIARQTDAIADAGEQGTKGVVAAFDRIPETVAKVAAATKAGVVTGATVATAAATAAIETVTQSRDFVGELVQGKV